jgi:hypothetical protein
MAFFSVCLRLLQICSHRERSSIVPPKLASGSGQSTSRLSVFAGVWFNCRVARLRENAAFSPDFDGQGNRRRCGNPLAEQTGYDELCIFVASCAPS